MQITLDYAEITPGDPYNITFSIEDPNPIQTKYCTYALPISGHKLYFQIVCPVTNLTRIVFFEGK